jgi:hypothetical protein
MFNRHIACATLSLKWEVNSANLNLLIRRLSYYTLIHSLIFVPDLRAQEQTDQAMHELMVCGPEWTNTKVIRFLERSSLVAKRSLDVVSKCRCWDLFVLCSSYFRWHRKLWDALSPCQKGCFLLSWYIRCIVAKSNILERARMCVQWTECSVLAMAASNGLRFCTRWRNCIL